MLIMEHLSLLHLKEQFGGLLIGISSVIGDLIASVLKRLASMKDSGGVIPGIGGLFRFN